MMELFRHALVRITGIPFNQLDFSSNPLMDTTMRLIEQDALAGNTAVALSDTLLRYNQSIQDGDTQKKIQNIRRAVFNRKALKPGDLSVLDKIPQSVAESVQQYLGQEERLAQLRTALAAAIATAFVDERRALQTAASNELLLKAISLASHSLYNDISKYLLKDPATFKSGEIHTEKSLLKYLSRTCAKTSPFSTLTSLSLAPMVVVPGRAAVINTGDATKQPPETYVRINNILLAFWKRMTGHDRDAVVWFPVHLNPTITMNRDILTFLINKNNVDFFQRIPLSPVLSFIIDSLKTSQGTCIHDLVNELEKSIDAERQSIESYIFSCVESGLIEIDLLVTGIDPNWNTTLLHRWEPYTQKVPGGSVSIITAALHEINMLCDQYSTTGSGERLNLSKMAYYIAEKASLAVWTNNRDQRIRRGMGEPPASNTFTMPLRPENIFMEDARQPLPFRLSETVMEHFCTALAGFYRHMDFFEGRKGELLKMYAYFLKKYPGESSVPLLRFYEDYYKDIRLREKKFTDLPQGEVPPGFEFVKYTGEIKRNKRDLLVKKWIDLLFEKTSFDLEQQVVSFMFSDIDETNKQLGIIPDLTKKHSAGAFIQCAFTGDPATPECTGIMVNSLSAAYGKMFSRFLYLFDDDITHDVRKSILDCMPANGLFAELQDAAYHNANLHPTLMPYEVRIPGGHIALSAEQQINTAMLRVSPNHDRESVQLIDTVTGKRVYSFDLGFQAPVGRSELFQLLCIFSYADYTSPQTLLTYINNKIFEATPKDKGVIIQPRIVYENNIVLQRKSWKIPLSIVPVRNSNEDFTSYYTRIIQWKNDLQLPGRVFVRAIEKSKRAELVESGKAGRDDYKPQYIDFNTVLFISLFEKLVTKAEDSIYIEEMYPLPEQQLSIHGENHVTEFYLQINDYGTTK